MSTDQRIALALRKARLLERIAAQRSELASHAAQLETPLALADKAINVVQFIKARPWIAGVAVLSAVVVGRFNLFRWVGRGWTVWRAVRFARQWLEESGIKKSK